MEYACRVVIHERYWVVLADLGQRIRRSMGLVVQPSFDYLARFCCIGWLRCVGSDSAYGWCHGRAT